MVALKTRLPLIVLAISILWLSFLLNPISYISASEELLWSVQSNPSILDDKPFATCLIEDYLYIVGYDRKTINAQFRIEKRYKYNGSLVKVWNYNPSSILDDILYDCVVVNNRLYVTGVVNMFSTYGGFESGKLFVAILDKDLNLLKAVEGPENTYGLSIESDGVYIYLGGIQRSGIYLRWYIEKRDLDLNLVTSKVYVFERPDNSDYLYSIRFNPVTNSLWAIGSIDAVWWGVVILDRDLSVLRIVKSDISGSAISIDFDDAGYAYVVGIGVRSDKSIVGIIKYDSSGSEVKRIPNYYGSKVFYVNGDVYVFYANPSKHIVYIYSRELLLRKTITLNNNSGCDSSYAIGKISTDGLGIYFATYKCHKGIYEDSTWVIYAFTPLTQRMYFTVTITSIKTTTVQISTTITTTRISTFYTTFVSTRTLTTSLIASVTTTVYLPTTLTHIFTSTKYIATPIISTYSSVATVIETISTVITSTSMYTITTTVPVTITRYEEPRTIYSIITSYITEHQTVTNIVTKTITVENPQNKDAVATPTNIDNYSTITITSATILIAGILLIVYLGFSRQKSSYCMNM